MKKEMEKVKVDLHVHYDFNYNEDSIIWLLKNAERNKVKTISLVGHNTLKLYAKDGLLTKLKEKGELSKIYSGKIVCGYEANIRTMDYLKNKTYDNMIIHFVCYNIDPNKIESAYYTDDFGEKIYFFTEESYSKLYYRDLVSFEQVCVNKGLDFPKDKSIFKAMGFHIPNQYYLWLQENEDSMNKAKKVLGEITTETQFVRTYVSNYGSPLYYEQQNKPSLIQLFELAQTGQFMVGIAHPFYMNPDFDAEEYIKLILNLAKKNNFRIKFIEGDYSLNSTEQTKVLKQNAKVYNMFLSGGSDARDCRSGKNPDGEMYYKDDKGLVYYKPELGTAIRYVQEGKNGDITIEKVFNDILIDINN